MIEARDYQIKSKELIREEFQKGRKKVLLWLATGAGKTFTFCDIVKDVTQNQMRSIIVVRGRKLVDQASKRLFREHVPHGVLMANHWNYRPQMPVQVCSIDTLIARKLKPECQLIIIDEADLFTQESKAADFIAQYENTHVISVTATPWLDKGLSHIAESVVHPITMRELIDRGYLVDFRYFAPSTPDLHDVKISSSTHDYVNDQLEQAMVAGQLTGQIIDHWQKIASDRPSLLFAVNIHHSKMLTKKFLNAGIKAEHCDADTPEEEREEIIKRLESGETKVVSNVGIFCRGVDIPSIGAIIMARPTQSLNLFIQQAGRGTRNAPGKTDCILLDHAGNVIRHGFPTEEEGVNLNGYVVTEHSEKKTKICKNCFCAYRESVCPECGYIPDKRTVGEIPDESNEQLQEIKPEEMKRLKKIKRAFKNSPFKGPWR